MIAAHTARRSLMDRLLLDGMDWTDKHPKTILGCLAIVILAGCCV